MLRREISWTRKKVPRLSVKRGAFLLASFPIRMAAFLTRKSADESCFKNLPSVNNAHRLNYLCIFSLNGFALKKHVESKSAARSPTGVTIGFYQRSIFPFQT